MQLADLESIFPHEQSLAPNFLSSLILILFLLLALPLSLPLALPRALPPLRFSSPLFLLHTLHNHHHLHNLNLHSLLRSLNLHSISSKLFCIHHELLYFAL